MRNDAIYAHYVDDIDPRKTKKIKSPRGENCMQRNERT